LIGSSFPHRETTTNAASGGGSFSGSPTPLGQKKSTSYAAGSVFGRA
jgi:hypothetical protein